MYGIVEYDSLGKPICELCGLSFHRLLSHVRQKHDMNERDYKLKFGLDLHKGICSEFSSQKTKMSTLLNYETCIKQNLIKLGEKSRFNKNHTGRTKDKVSEQTKIMLRNRLKESYMVEVMKESGKLLGLSGIGNKVRWGK